MPFYDFNSFLDSFNAELQTWYGKTRKLLEKIRVTFNAPNLTVDWKQAPPDLTSVFNDISGALPDYSLISLPIVSVVCFADL